MNNMEVVTAPLTDDNYDDMEINDDSETYKMKHSSVIQVYFSDDF